MFATRFLSFISPKAAFHKTPIAIGIVMKRQIVQNADRQGQKTVQKSMLFSFESNQERICSVCYLSMKYDFNQYFGQGGGFRVY